MAAARPQAGLRKLGISRNLLWMARWTGAARPPCARSAWGGPGWPVCFRSGGFGLELVFGDGARILALGGDVAIDELDDRDRRGVGGADARLDDSGVAPVTARVTRRQHVEQLPELSLVEQTGVGEPAVGKAAALGEGHQLLDIGAKLLRLGGGGGDLLVLDERGRHVAEQGRAVAGSALELTPADAMTHGSVLRSSRNRIGTPSNYHFDGPWYSGPRGL